MRLTDWLTLLRFRHEWPPEMVAATYPSQSSPHGKGRPSGDSLLARTHRHAPWRFRVPTRRLPVGIRSELAPQPSS